MKSSAVSTSSRVPLCGRDNVAIAPFGIPVVKSRSATAGEAINVAAVSANTEQNIDRFIRSSFKKFSRLNVGARSDHQVWPIKMRAEVVSGGYFATLRDPLQQGLQRCRLRSTMPARRQESLEMCLIFP
jgi:hypothetical protein